MQLPAWFRSLAAKFFRGSRTAQDLDDELRAHICNRAADLERSGVDAATAERRARMEFGAFERYREESHEAMGGNFLETTLQDIRFSVRVLLKSPGFLAAAVLTLALAIGANALVFGILNALILRPVDLPGVESLFDVANPKGFGDQSYPDYRDLRDRNHTLEGLAALTIVGAGLDTGKDPSQVWLFEISGNYFDMLGVQPYAGRLIHASDERGPNSAPWMVLTWAYWHSHFNGDPHVIGRTVQINKHPFTIIGITPPNFHGNASFITPDGFVPLVNQAELGGDPLLENRGAHYCITALIGRLKPGVTAQQAAADLNNIGAWLERTYPKDDANLHYTLTRPGLFGSFLGKPVKAFVTGLMLLASLILLAACANLGSLFAARAADRSREVALRLALGSSRTRILRQLLTEAVLISLGGGALGLAGSVALLTRLNGWQPFPRWPIHIGLAPDIKVYIVALVLAVVSGILFGVVPVRQVMRATPYEVVKAGSTGTPGRRLTLRDVLLVVQIALCAVLVTASMVAIRGLERSLHSNFGFDPQNVMLAMTDLRTAGYSSDQAVVMEKRMIDSMQTLPGVQKVGLINSPPLDAGVWLSNVFTDTTIDLRPANAVANVYWFNVSPEYFDAAHTSLWAGRAFTWHDDKNAPAVAIVNRAFAAQVLGSTTDVIGRSFKMPDGTREKVVGLVEDGKYLSLTEDPKPAMFLPILQNRSSQSWLVIRGNVPPQNLDAAVRNRLLQLDAGLPAYIVPWNQELDFALFPSRVASVALGILGFMGAMLSVTGIFGMAAYSVSKRLRELGIRIALGAPRQQVLATALGRALRLLAVGSVAGVVLGLLAARVLATIVYEATPRDPVVLGGVVLAMTLLGLLATWLPAQRALSADPLRLLREE